MRVCMTLHLNLLRLALAGASGKALALWVLCVPLVSLAQTNVSDTHSSVQAVGRVLGMMLFAYLALKWFNRKKDRNDDASRGFLGLPVKPWVVWLVVIGGLALLMARSG